MTSGGPEAGEPWPDRQHTEVVSPSGARAYLAASAADLAERTTRWATKLASDGVVAAERGRMRGQRGGDVWFLDADQFEALGLRQGWWPPESLSLSDFEVLESFETQRLRREIATLRQRVVSLEEQLAKADEDRQTLLAMTAQLATISARTISSRGSG